MNQENCGVNLNLLLSFLIFYDCEFINNKIKIKIILIPFLLSLELVNTASRHFGVRDKGLGTQNLLSVATFHTCSSI